MAEANLWSKNEDNEVTEFKNKNSKLMSEEKKQGNQMKNSINSNKDNSKISKPRRIPKLPYGCVWKGKENRFAIRLVPPKLKTGL